MAKTLPISEVKARRPELVTGVKERGKSTIESVGSVPVAATSEVVSCGCG
jgi:hypothetical protein